MEKSEALLYPDVKKRVFEEIGKLFSADDLKPNLKYVAIWRSVSKGWRDLVDTILARRKDESFLSILDEAILKWRRIPTMLFDVFGKRWNNKKDHLIRLWAMSYLTLERTMDLLEVLAFKDKDDMSSDLMRTFKEMKNKIESPKKCTELFELIVKFCKTSQDVLSYSEGWIFLMEQMMESDKDDELLDHLVEYTKGCRIIRRSLRNIHWLTLKSSPNILRWAFEFGIRDPEITVPYHKLPAREKKIYPSKQSETVPLIEKKTKESNNQNSISESWSKFAEEKQVESSVKEIQRIDHLALHFDLSRLDQSQIDAMDPMSMAKNDVTDPLVLKKLLVFHPQMNVGYRQYFDETIQEKPDKFRKELVSLWFKQPKPDPLPPSALDPIDLIESQSPVESEEEYVDVDEEEDSSS